MLPQQWEKLENRSSEWLSIGLTADGKPRGSIPVPWYSDTQAYNMKLPDVYLAPEDCLDGGLLAELEKRRVIGCYVFCPLPDYSWLARFPELMDLSISCGEGVKNTEFLSALPELRMLFLEGASLPDLDRLFETRRRNFRCLALYDCRVESLESLVNYTGFLSEIIIANPRDRDERERWKPVRCGKVRYYDFRG